MRITMIGGISARSRSRAMASPTPLRPGATSGGNASVRMVTVSVTAELNPFHSGDERLVVPRATHLGDHLAAEHHHDAMAVAEVVQVVGDDQDARSARRRLGGCVHQRPL